MSLYRAREWWSTTCGQSEEYDARSVVIGALGSDTAQQGQRNSVDTGCCSPLRCLKRQCYLRLANGVQHLPAWTTVTGCRHRCAGRQSGHGQPAGCVAHIPASRAGGHRRGPSVGSATARAGLAAAAGELYRVCFVGVLSLGVIVGVWVAQLRVCCRLGGYQLAVLHPRSLVIYSLTGLGSSQGIAGLQLNVVSQHSLQRSAANFVCGNFGQSTGGKCCLQLSTMIQAENADSSKLLQVLCRFVFSPWMGS